MLYTQNKLPISKWVKIMRSWNTSLNEPWVQLSRYLTVEHHEWSKPGNKARGWAGGDITLVWLREASPSQCLHKYPAGFEWQRAQLQYDTSWHGDDVIDEVSLSHAAALTCSSWHKHLCSCHSITVWFTTLASPNCRLVPLFYIFKYLVYLSY